MDAGKTLDLLKVAYNYTDRGQHALVITSAIDKRAGNNIDINVFKIAFIKQHFNFETNSYNHLFHL